MMPGVRRQDRRFWIACLVAGSLVLLGCLLPTIEIGQGAFIGAGETQRSFEYDRVVRFSSYAEPGARLFLVGALALVLLAILGLARGSTAVLVLSAAVVSFVLVVQVARISPQLRWVRGGVWSCNERPRLEDCAPFVAPAVRDLQSDIRGRPEAAEPGFQLLNRNGYRSRGKVGWWLIAWASAAAALITSFRALRLVLSPGWAALAVGVGAFLFLAVVFLRSLEGLE
jgi:hypothetical protein